MRTPKGFIGWWSIDHTDDWDREALDLLGRAHIDFAPNRTGVMQLIAVEVFLDCRFSVRDGSPWVDFSFDGQNELDPTSGRGWATVVDGGSLVGHIYFHMGDDSPFTASRSETAELDRPGRGDNT